MSSDCQPALHEIAADDLSTWLRDVAGKCRLSNQRRELLYRFGCNFLKRASVQKLHKHEARLFEKSKGEVRNALLHYA
jgi:hypothetical protein